MYMYTRLTQDVKTRANTVQHNARDHEFNYENGFEYSCSEALPMQLNLCRYGHNHALAFLLPPLAAASVLPAADLPLVTFFAGGLFVSYISHTRTISHT